MRVLVAPDKFAGTLAAAEAAEAIATGWRRHAPADQLVLAPLSDGGPGFLDTLHAVLGGRLLVQSVSGPQGEPVPAAVLVAGDTAYVESAQACGLHLVPADRRDTGASTTYGVGELILAAIRSGARRVIVGLGGSATTDGGAGALAALGARPAGALRRGGAALAGLDAVDVAPARAAVAGVDLVAASDVDNPLLGLRGASNVFGPQKGAGPEQVQALDAALARWAELTDRAVADLPGAGAAGGLGFGLLLLGGRRVPGIATVMEVVGFAAQLPDVDLVLTGEGAFDPSSLRGKVVSGVAAAAAAAARPTLVLAGRVEVGRREQAAAGISGAYAVVDHLAAGEDPLTRPADRLADLAERVARTWSRPG